MLFQANNDISVEYFMCDTTEDTIPELVKVRYENIRNVDLADKILKLFHAQIRHTFPTTSWGKLCKTTFARSLVHQHNNSLSLESKCGVYVKI